MNTQDTNFAQIARDFVTLALKEGTWKDNKDKQLSDTDRATVLKTVAAAGFKPGAIIFGPLSTGSDISSYIINTTCPYKVAGEDGEDDKVATAWLEGLVRTLTNSEWVDSTSPVKIVEFIQAEIERVVPLEPIQLTQQGDFLIDVGASDNRTRDDYGLRVGYVGAHMYTNHLPEDCDHVRRASEVPGFDVLCTNANSHLRSVGIPRKSPRRTRAFCLS